MNIRLRGTTGLAINYTMQIVIVLVIAEGFNYFLDGIVSVPFMMVLVLTINTLTLKHMRNYWMDVIVGDIKAYSDHRPGFTNEIIEASPTKKGTNTDLNELLQQATRKKVSHSDLKKGLLDD